LTDRLIRVLLILHVLGVFFPVAHADDYRLDPNPQYTTGTLQVLADFEEPADPEVCQIYLRNLQYFARLNTPMSCRRPITPQYKSKIQAVEWENFDPNQYPELFGAIINIEFYGKANRKEAFDEQAREVREGSHVLRRAKLELSGTFIDDETQKQNSTAERFHIIQYGENVIDPENPSPVLRCKPCRGGGPEHDKHGLHLYIASADLKRLRTDLTAYGENGQTGEHLLAINGRPYVESITSAGYVTLMEISTDWPIGLKSVCGFEFLRSSKAKAQPGRFDCRRAASEAEKLICDDDELSKLAASLNKAYLQALERTDIRKQKKRRIVESQRQWLKNERNACKNAECLKKAYETRIKELGLSSYGIVIESPPHGTTSPSESPSKVSESQPTEAHGKAVETELGQQHRATVTAAEPISGTYSRSDLVRDWSASGETYFRAESEMVLSMKDKNTFHFDLGLVGSNFHTCTLSGLGVRRGPFFEYRGTKPIFDAPEDCVLKFWFQEDSVRLEHEPGKCGNACGARARLDGAVLFRSGAIPKANSARVTVFYLDENYRPVVKLERLGPLSDGMRAILAMYALQNGAGCSGGNENIRCSLTDSLSIGAQCSKEHVNLIRTWFRQSIPKMGGYGDDVYKNIQTPGGLEAGCYEKPDGATFQSIWDKIRVTQNGNHVIVDAHGKWLAREKTGSFRYLTEYRINNDSVTVISHKEMR
jgi:uncharacterized protein